MDAKPGPAARPAAPSSSFGRVAVWIAGLAIVVAAAFGAGWVFSARHAAAVTAKAESPLSNAGSALPAVTADDMGVFLKAAASADLAAMLRSGVVLFQPGRAVSGREVLGGYEVNGFPPNRVYVFHAGTVGDAVQRAVLTLNGDGRVVSFIAEEMPLVR